MYLRPELETFQTYIPFIRTQRKCVMQNGYLIVGALEGTSSSKRSSWYGKKLIIIY